MQNNARQHSISLLSRKRLVTKSFNILSIFSITLLFSNKTTNPLLPKRGFDLSLNKWTELVSLRINK